MKLTHHQIDDLVAALTRFNPKDAHIRTTIRLNRNLRKLKSAWDDLQHDRIRLAASVVIDQSKTNQNGQLLLNAAEQQKFEEKWAALLKESQEVEIHPIEIFSSKNGEKPKDAQHAIDLDEVKPEPAVLSVLLDVVLVETNPSNNGGS